MGEIDKETKRNKLLNERETQEAPTDRVIKL